MLLRSSSTPVLFSDSPNRDFDTINSSTKHPSFQDHNPTKLSIFHGHPQPIFNAFSFNSSSVSLSASGSSHSNRKPNSSRLGVFRRTQSDSNLEGLASNFSDIDDLQMSNSSTRSLQSHKSVLRTVPSFSIFNKMEDDGEDNEEEPNREEPAKWELSLMRSVTIGDSVEAIGCGDFSFQKDSMDLIEEEENEEDGLNEFQKLDTEEEDESASPPLFLATGLGIDLAGFGGDSGGGAGFTAVNFDESGDAEKYYKKMVDEYPCHPLFLRNYAQLLQSNGDLDGAEEYYFRATLADPGDGEILMQYARLGWELHHDQRRASTYFKRAAEASPQNSHVLAAYASFLWEIGDDEDEDDALRNHIQKGLNDVLPLAAGEENKVFSSSWLPVGLETSETYFCNGNGDVGLAAAAPSDDESVEKHLKRMVDENPCNPLFLRNYAQFLNQSKGDLQQAVEYYLRAMLADPGDGEIKARYAKLVWELHHDQDKALCYFKQAVQANPGDSHVLAAYASFLWETEEQEEDGGAQQHHIQVPVFHSEAMASANA